MQRQNSRKQKGQKTAYPTDSVAPAYTFCLLPSAFCLPSVRRRGITLMEVLISIGIMAIGLVSVASLLPVGGLQQQKANVEERKAQLVLNAVRDFHVRGMAAVRDPVNFPWVIARTNSAQPYFRVVGTNKLNIPTAATGAGLGRCRRWPSIR